MRVSTHMIYGDVGQRLNAQAGRLTRLGEQISSGQRLQRPSDDPAAAGRVARLDSALSDVKQYRASGNAAKDALSAADSAIGQLGGALREARRIALAGANSSVGQSQRDALVAEAEKLAAQVKQIAETQYAGRYLFSGNDTRTSPLAATGDPAAPYSFAGDDGRWEMEVAEGVIVAANVGGRELLNFGGAGDPTAPDVFALLADLKDRLSTGNATALSSLVESVDKLSATVSDVRTQVGSSIQRLEANDTSLAEQEEMVNIWRSDLTGVDLAQAMVDYQSQDLTYQATIALSARMDRQSLFELLR